ncbi:MAG: M12 family metallopeptidase [Xenococcaceae cyanobacterium]
MASFINHLAKAISLSKDELSRLDDSVPIVEQDGRKYYKIDDMLFPCDVIVTKGFAGGIWTNSEVFYEFNSNVTDENQTRFLDASKEWSDITNIKFIERTDQKNYIYVQSDTVNSSAVGMVGGKQTLKIFNWKKKFTIAHEIAHALGVVHEHCRSDRDNYIKINEANIIEGKEQTFLFHNSSMVANAGAVVRAWHGARPLSRPKAPTDWSRL